MTALVNGTIHFREGHQLLFTQVRESEVHDLVKATQVRGHEMVELYEFYDGDEASRVIYINPSDVSSILVNL